MGCDFIYNCLEKEQNFSTKPNAKIVWIGGKPHTEIFTKSKKGNSWEMLQLTFFSKTSTFDITVSKESGLWLVEILQEACVTSGTVVTFSSLKENYETTLNNFELFWYSKPIDNLRNQGLLLL